jgi:CRISPR-associated protein (TIGR03984 family)
MSGQLFITSETCADPIARAKELVGGGKAYGMAMSPGSFSMFILKASGAIWPGEALSAANTFQIVIFSETFELSALRNGAMFDMTIKRESGLEAHALIYEGDPITSNFHIWGSYKKHHGDFAEMVSSRIGSIFVPAPAHESGKLLALTSKEYIAIEPDHGNAYIAAERLMGIKWIEAKVEGK